MKSIRTVLALALAAAALSCGGSSGPGTTPRPKPNTVDVSIASVTLADDCGTGPTTIPSEPVAAADEPADRSIQQPGASRTKMQGARACEQSSIQLRVANTTAAASKVVIQKIVLVDENGDVVGELVARDPSRWGGDSYQAWDEAVAPSEVLQVSYALSAPVVSRGATYTVRVTLAADDGERTLEQRTTIEAEASMPPDVVT